MSLHSIKMREQTIRKGEAIEGISLRRLYRIMEYHQGDTGVSSG